MARAERHDARGHRHQPAAVLRLRRGRPAAGQLGRPFCVPIWGYHPALRLRPDILQQVILSPVQGLFFSFLFPIKTPPTIDLIRRFNSSSVGMLSSLDPIRALSIYYKKTKEGKNQQIHCYIVLCVIIFCRCQKRRGLDGGSQNGAAAVQGGSSSVCVWLLACQQLRLLQKFFFFFLALDCRQAPVPKATWSRRAPSFSFFYPSSAGVKGFFLSFS